MKKFLLSACVVGIAASASAVEPFVIPQSNITAFSPDNKIAASSYFDNLFIFDLDKLGADPVIYNSSADGLTTYNTGLGACISDKFICAHRGNLGTAVWIYRFAGDDKTLTGRWQPLNAKEPNTGMGAAHAVTADSKRICGNLPTGVEFGVETDGLMVAPCIWDYTGSTFKRTLLPYPEKDYAGLAPQYVTALSISDDGRTIIGQSVSNNGFLKEYIIYTQAEDGTWSYRRPFADLVNPNKRELPTYPEGEAPVVPSPESYMTEAELEAYTAAYNAWYDAGADEATMPQYGSYMTQEEAEAYNKAAEISNNYQLAVQAYLEADLKIRDESITFVFNQGAISPNGKYLASTTETGYYTSDAVWHSTYKPLLYDIENDKIIVNDGPSILVTGVSDDGDVIGYERRDDIEFGYVLPAGATEWMPLEKWVVERNPELAEWVEKNWKHEIQVIIDPDEDITEFRDMYITGMPFMSRDFSMLSTVAYYFWNDAPSECFQSYCSSIVPLGAKDAIREVAAEAKPADSQAVFNLQGVRVDKPSTPGIYISNGKKFVVK